MAVQEGRTDRAVVPIENSLEGGVAATLDALAGEADGVRIAAEVVHPIHHYLIAARPLELGEVDARALPPPGHGAVRALPAREPGRRRAGAGHLHRRGGAHRAGLRASRGRRSGSRLSAELYGCEVLAERVEDRPDNLTRFVWLAPAGDAPVELGSAFAKTSIVFWGFNDDVSRARSWTCCASSRTATSTSRKIESRPRRVALGPLHVLRRPRRARAASRTWRRRWRRSASGCETLRVLGSYPADAGAALDCRAP